MTKQIPLTIIDNPIVLTANADALLSGSLIDHLHVTATEGYAPYDYTWTQTGGAAATISDDTSENPEVTLPASGDYTFKVTVTDSIGNSTDANVSVRAVDALHIDAGSDFLVNEDTNVSLHGLSTGSYGVASIKWTQTAGTPVTLTGDDTLTPTFTSPITADIYNEQLTFKLTVTDVKGNTLTDSVNIAVQPVLPSVSITAPTSVPAGTTSIATCNIGSEVNITKIVLWNREPADYVSDSNFTQSGTLLKDLTFTTKGDC